MKALLNNDIIEILSKANMIYSCKLTLLIIKNNVIDKKKKKLIAYKNIIY